MCVAVTSEAGVWLDGVLWGAAWGSRTGLVRDYRCSLGVSFLDGLPVPRRFQGEHLLRVCGLLAPVGLTAERLWFGTDWLCTSLALTNREMQGESVLLERLCVCDGKECVCVCCYPLCWRSCLGVFRVVCGDLVTQQQVTQSSNIQNLHS